MDYLDKERFFYEDREIDVEKTWLVIADESEIIFSTRFQQLAEDVLCVAKEKTERKLEIGWVDENEVCSDFGYVYRLFNPIKL